MLLRRPPDDPRRRYRTFCQLGLAGALAVSLAAFTVPYGPDAPEAFTVAPDEPLILDRIPPTAMTPPPPPPALPPPPVEVPDDVEIEAEILDEVELRLDDVLPPPVAPTPPVVTPPEPAPVPPVPPPVIVPPTPPDEIPEPREQDVFEVVEQQPTLIGGMDGLRSRVEYPRLARDAGIEGRVFIQFVVDERGNVVDPVVARSPSELLSEAALKAVRASRFTPGVQSGRPVKVRFVLPVTFELD